MRKALIFTFIYSTNISFAGGKGRQRMKEGREGQSQRDWFISVHSISSRSKEPKSITVNLSIFLLSGRRYAVLAHIWFWMLSRQILNTNLPSAHIISLLPDLIGESHKVKLTLWGPPPQLTSIGSFHFNPWTFTVCELVSFLPKHPYSYSNFLDNYFWYPVWKHGLESHDFRVRKDQIEYLSKPRH